jgi:hypothetical protein
MSARSVSVTTAFDCNLHDADSFGKELADENPSFGWDQQFANPRQVRDYKWHRPDALVGFFSFTPVTVPR